MKPIIFKTALLAVAFSLSACSSAPEKKDDKVVTQAADDMGMKQEAVENFQIALNEFAKEKPDKPQKCRDGDQICKRHALSSAMSLSMPVTAITTFNAVAMSSSFNSLPITCITASSRAMMSSIS